jgi:hypothetical protein
LCCDSKSLSSFIKKSREWVVPSIFSFSWTWALNPYGLLLT